VISSRVEFVAYHGLTPEEFDRLADQREAARFDIENRVQSAHVTLPHKQRRPSSESCPECFDLEKELIADAGLLRPYDDVG
jgi:hypothetical protein